jgi:DNA-binding MarR family transcriptional regulator
MVDQHAAAEDLAQATQANCLGMRVARLHRIVTRAYERALEPLDLSVPQMEILSALVTAAGPVRPAALAAELMVERSTLSRNLALMRDRGWLAPAEISPTGRSMSVAITEPGRGVFASARTAWQSAQAGMTRTLGPTARGTLDGWLALLAEADGHESGKGTVLHPST